MKNMKVKLVLSMLVVAGCDPGSPFGFEPSFASPSNDQNDGGLTPADGAFDAVTVDSDAAGGATDSSENEAGKVSEGAGGSGTGGAAKTCSGVIHDNGVGQVWIDCVPLRTYNIYQALMACSSYTASTGSGDCHVAPGCGTAIHVVQTPSSDPKNYVWGYEGNTTGYVGIEGACPNPVNGKQWN